MPKLKKGTLVPAAAENAAINRAAKADPDNPPLSDAMLARMQPVRGRPKLENPKVPVTMRLDSDVHNALKASGPGWQTRVNAMLKKAVKAGRL